MVESGAGAGRKDLTNQSQSRASKPATRAQCSGGAPCGRRAGGGGLLVRLRARGGGGGTLQGTGSSRAAAAMAHPGKLLKEQKYDRQLRLAGAHRVGRAGQ